jgi:two-component sensor histidine kinase
LSSAHDVLLKENWAEAQITAVISNVLQSFGSSDRFHIVGPELTLGARNALSMSLLLHELTTNALKYGALSSDKGRVRLDWQTDEGDDQFVLRWQETGGPAAHTPSQSGFGSRIIKMGLRGNGRTALRYLVSGFEADFSSSLTEIRT